MKKYYYLLVLLYCQQTVIFAQSSFPTYADQPVWTYNEFWWGQQTPDPLIITATAEMSACGYNWTQLRANKLAYHADPTDFALVGYYRVEGQQVYFRNSLACSSPEWLLYDFSLSAGDTTYYRWTNFNGDTTLIPMTVYSANYHDFGGVLRKVVYLVGNYFYTPGSTFSLPVHLTYIEGIGDQLYPFFNLLDCPIGLCDATKILACMKQGDTVKYSTGATAGCTYDLTRLHVKHDVQGGARDGSSWANAFQRLEDAIAIARPGDSIWVARGTYYPTTGTNRETYFELKNGVVLLGGFGGFETEYEQRTPEAYETILSGDIGTPGAFEDNSYHVLYCIGADSSTFIDGFTIRGGNADASGVTHRSYGGGMVVIADGPAHPHAAPRIHNCRFEQNRGFFGAGLAFKGGQNTAATADVQNCSFERNRSNLYGGGLLWTGAASLSQEQMFSGCTFDDNYALLGGGGAIMYVASGNFIFEDCSFSRDSCVDGAGGIYLFDIPERSEITVRNSDFTENYGNTGGAIGSTSPGIYSSFRVNIFDSRFFGNFNNIVTGGALFFDILGDSTFVRIRGSLFENNVSRSSGGAMSVFTGSNRHSNIHISDCVFKGNRSLNVSYGGALYIWGQLDGGGSRSHSLVENCLFTGNRGAIGLTGGLGAADLYVYNSTFYNNGTLPIAKPWLETFNENFFSRITLANTVLWEPSQPLRRILSNNSSFINLHMYRLDNCLISAADCNLTGGDEACGEGMIFNLDPGFVDSTGGDFRPRGCSPLLDAGGNQWLQGLNLPTDLGGLPRIRGGTVDIGAYEGLAFGILSHEVVTTPTCHDAADGEVLLVTVEEQPYSVAWQNAGGQQGTDLQWLAGGAYIFTVTDENGCTDTLSLTIEAPLALQGEVTVTPASGPAATDGVALMGNLSGGMPPYTISWSNGAVADGIAGLLPGHYAVTVSDQNGCMYTLEFTVPFTSAAGEAVLPGSFRIVPNPSGGSAAQLVISGRFEWPLQVEVFDALGRRVVAPMVMRTAVLDLPAGDLLPGLYAVLVTDAQGRRATVKWVRR
ncbi:MAG: hypothetical protein KF852_00845 [Saprospiraceae bacterium]|nr:hypothetical protein [Saprospiraceae bacterium]